MPHVLADEYQQECPIWGTPAQVFRYGNPPSKVVSLRKVVSPRVGVPYLVNIHELGENDKFDDLQEDEDKAKLTTMIIERYGKEGLHYVGDEYVKQAKEQRTIKTSKRISRLLKYLVEKSEENLIGYELHMNPDYLQQEVVHHHFNRYLGNDEYAQSVKTCYEALAWSESRSLQELHFLIRQLETAKLLDVIKVYGQGLSCKITHEGYLKIEKDIVNKDSSQAFVAMWFGNNNESEEEMNNLYDNGIDQAIKNVGYEALRIDRKKDVDKIDDEILAEIRRSRFLVADYTYGNNGVRGGVYYEAGFAQGLGIPVFRSCRSDKFDDLHFDTRQYYHIKWDTPEQLRKELEDRIRASSIGEGPEIGGAR